MLQRNFFRQLSKEGHRLEANDRLHPTRINYLRATNPAFFPLVTPMIAGGARFRGKTSPHPGYISPPINPDINPFPVTPMTPGVQPRRHTNEFNNTPTFKLNNPKNRRKSKDRKSLKESPSVESDQNVDKEKQPQKPRFLVTPVNRYGEGEGGEVLGESKIDIPDDPTSGENHPLMK